MSQKVEKLIIVGKTGSGKDFLYKKMSERGLKCLPKFTTRPMRDGETNGVEYNFIANEYLNELIASERIKVYQTFKIFEQTWIYGITTSDFINGQVFIMTPYEIKQLSEQDRKDCFIVFLDIDDEIRRGRLVIRNDNNDSISRRMSADDEDFNNFVEWDLKITDPEFDSDMVYELMN